jgi:hypothetical protein
MFCQSCGAQTTGAFCTKCGARASQAPQPAATPPPPPPPPVQQQYTPPPPPPQYAPPQYSQPLPQAAKSGSGLKILLVVLVILGLMGMLAVGGVWYAWHKTKEIAASNGIDLNGITETRRGPARRFDACALLTKDELSQILNLNIERVESTGKSTSSTCTYYSSEAQQRGLDEAAAAKKRIEDASKTGNGKPDAAETMKDFGNIVRGMTAAGGPALGQTNGLVLSVAIDSQNAKAAMAGFKLGMGLSSAVVTKDADPAVKAAMREDVKGVGDEAMSGPLLSLFMFRKGDVAVTLDARLLPGGRDAQIAIAKLVASKL